MLIQADDGANIVSSYRRSGGGDPYGNFNFGINPGDSRTRKGFADHGVIIMKEWMMERGIILWQLMSQSDGS